MRFELFYAIVFSLICSACNSNDPAKNEKRNSVGFGEASAIMASKCDRFGTSGLLKGRCLDAYADAYYAGKDLYSIILDDNARPFVAPLPIGVDHYPGEKAETVMSGARPIEQKPSPTNGTLTKEAQHPKPKKHHP